MLSIKPGMLPKPHATATVNNRAAISFRVIIQFLSSSGLEKLCVSPPLQTQPGIGPDTILRNFVLPEAGIEPLNRDGIIGVRAHADGIGVKRSEVF